jgi:hypothetical protein
MIGGDVMSKLTTETVPVLYESAWWTRLAAFSESRKPVAAARIRRRSTSRFSGRIVALLRSSLTSLFVK